MKAALESVRAFCLGLPGATEDVKWGADLAFSVGGKMFCVVCLDPPHQMSFKSADEAFAELVERSGMRPAPYLARAMWVQEEALGESLERREREDLLRAAYELVKAKLPGKTRAGLSRPHAAAKRRPATRKRRR